MTQINKTFTFIVGIKEDYPWNVIIKYPETVINALGRVGGFISIFAVAKYIFALAN